MIARAILALSLVGTTASAAETRTSTSTTATHIASQPARDIGASKQDIPVVLQTAAKAPYTLKGLQSCAQLSRAIGKLNEVLGADFDGDEEVSENRAGKLAEAGGKTVVNSLLPFRGLVCEVSGAAPAERRYAAAVSAGYARRGFLRGVARERHCKFG